MRGKHAVGGGAGHMHVLEEYGTPRYRARLEEVASLAARLELSLAGAAADYPGTLPALAAFQRAMAAAAAPPPDRGC